MLRTLRPVLAALLGGVLLGGCSDEATAPATASLVGSLTYRASGEPLDDAIVVLVDPGTLIPVVPPVRTDAAGAFAFHGLPTGLYSLWLYHPSAVILGGDTGIHVAPDIASTFHRQVIDNPLWNGDGPVVQGVVRDASTGEPLVGAYVGTASLPGIETIFAMAGGSSPGWAITDETGAFTVSEFLTLGPGEVAPLSAMKAGYRPHTLVGTGADHGPLFGGAALVVDGTLTVEIRLVPGTGLPTGSLTGRVIDPVNLRAIPGLQVTLDLIAAAERDTVPGPAPLGVPMPGFPTVTDATGHFRFDGLPPGAYVVEVAPAPDDGYIQENAYTPGDPVTVTADQTRDVGSRMVYEALRPLSPPAGDEIATATPTFTFPTVRGATSYEVQYGTGYILDHQIPLDAPVWTVPDEAPLPAGVSIRWQGVAYRNEGETVRVIGRFEVPAVFTIRGSTANQPG